MNNQTNKQNPGISKLYFISVSVLTLVLPLICSAAQILSNKNMAFSFDLFGKWFIFSAVGLRLFLAGIKQATNPGFTAKQIFHIDSPDSFPIVRELGFANLCFGLIGIISLFMPQWRVVSAFASGLYYGMAGLLHLIKKPVGANEMLALVSDILIFIFLLIYFVKMM